MNIEVWIDEIIPKHKRLTNAIQPLIRSLLDNNEIEYLSVTGRTKAKKSILEKIDRKSYKVPENQLTDISGIRIILFIEADVDKVEEIIANSFEIDGENSTNKNKTLQANQVGYRSKHFVCDIGKQRSELPEFADLANLKFEIQVRTVLQHAWAELAHDRSYKFQGTLPDKIQRQLNLYAGMLEIADTGFNEIAASIEVHKNDIQENYEKGNLDVELDSISISKFMESWFLTNNFLPRMPEFNTNYDELIMELSFYDVNTIRDLKDIIPKDFAEISKGYDEETNVLGLVRLWMLISDPSILFEVKSVDWMWDISEHELDMYQHLATPENYEKVLELIESNNSVFLVDEDGNEIPSPNI